MNAWSNQPEIQHIGQLSPGNLERALLDLRDTKTQVNPFYTIVPQWLHEEIQRHEAKFDLVRVLKKILADRIKEIYSGDQGEKNEDFTTPE
jgi:hypothetical protein